MMDHESDGGYTILRDLFGRGKVVPFLGAGASMSDGIGEEDPAIRLPTAKDLAPYLAERAHLSDMDLSTSDLLQVASVFALWFDRLYLEKELERVFTRAQEPSSIHEFLASVPSPLLIVTTNYDTLIERAFLQATRDFHLIMTPTWSDDGIGFRNDHHALWWAPGAKEPKICPLRQLFVTPEDIPIIYKVHSGFDTIGKWHDSVITEDDYFEIGGRIYESSLLPPQVHSRLTSSSLLFLGYSLRDVHVRHLIFQLRRFSDQGRRNFLVSKVVTALDRARFGQRDLQIYEMTIAQFVETLRARFQTAS